MSLIRVGLLDDLAHSDCPTPELSLSPHRVRRSPNNCEGVTFSSIATVWIMLQIYFHMLRTILLLV